MTDQAFWEQKYTDGRTGWDRGGVSPALADWLDGGSASRAISPPARVVVPGCGRGYEVIALARAGYQVTAIDIATQPLEFLRAALDSAAVEAQLVQADVLEWQPEQPFDAVYEQTCLCALPPALWRGYASQLHAWLRPGGVMLAMFMQTQREGGPPYHCDLGEMRALFPEHHWHWEQHVNERLEHPNDLHEHPFYLTRR